MKFGTKVLVIRGSLLRTNGTPGCKRVVKGILIGAYEHQRIVRLTENDPFDTVGWSKKGSIGCWEVSQVKEDPSYAD